MEWEYLVEENLGQNELNELGKKGWELVTVIMKHYTDERKGYEEWSNYYYLKRQVYDERLRGLIEYRIGGTGIHLAAIPPGKIEHLSDERYTAQYLNDPATERGAADRSISEREHKGETGTDQAEVRSE